MPSPKITADGDFSHEIKRRLLLGRKVMTNLYNIFKSRDITLPTKVRLVKAIYCHPAYLTYMQNTSCKNAGLDEAQAGIKMAGRNINNLRYVDDTTFMAESEEELKSLLMKVKEESEKVGSTFRKQRSWHLVPSLHGK